MNPQPAFVFDIESDALLDAVRKVHCIVVHDLTTGRFYRFNSVGTGDGSIEQGLELLSTGELLIGHNIVAFDIPALKKLYPWFNPKAKLRDTLVCSRVIWPDRYDLIFKDGRAGVPSSLRGLHSLKAWGYRLKELKGDFGSDPEDAEKVWEEWSQEMEDYCVQDVVVTTKLWRLIESKQWSEESLELEHRFRALIALQENHGWRIDVAETQQLYTTLAKRRLELETELQRVFPPKEKPMKLPAYYEDAFGNRYATKKEAPKGVQLSAGPARVKLIPFNPNSNDQIAARLTEKYGWKPTEFTDGGKPKITDEILGAMVYPEAKPLAEFLMVQKRIGQVAEGEQAWLKLERNGRIYGSVTTNGAVTGRCAHRNPNVAQVPSVSKGKNGVLMGSEGGYGWECRYVWKADDGWVLVGCDASGLELRCLAHFMGRYDGGAYAKILLEGDIHSENQRAAGLPTRDNAKTFILIKDDLGETPRLNLCELSETPKSGNTEPSQKF